MSSTLKLISMFSQLLELSSKLYITCTCIMNNNVLIRFIEYWETCMNYYE